jgi:hypothetical protein
MPDDRLGVSHQLRFDAIADADPRHLRLFELVERNGFERSVPR